MSGGNQNAGGEIVIIRRKGADEVAAHKGGAWKIAYADFVTAMMAFFLVMWLINAANDATRSQVASYFNPIKLTDSATGAKGLNDPKDIKSNENKLNTGTSEKATDAEKRREQQVLVDPVQTLDRIAGESTQPQNSGPERTGGSSPHGSGDPFDPPPWHSPALAAHSSSPKATAPVSQSRNSLEMNSKESAQPEPTSPNKSSPADDRVGAPSHVTNGVLNDTKAELPQQALATERIPPTTKTASDRNPSNGGDERAQTAQEIKAEIMKKLNVDPAQLPANIDVRATPEGYLINLTDRSAFGMFEIGSSEPDPKLVGILAAIAQVAKDRPGYLVIRGHTDSRPYRNRRYDNWQLSAARAQMAYYMLLRGGLDDSRVKRIEGLADRDPLIPDHPDAPENRRIEILLGQSS